MKPVKEALFRLYAALAKSLLRLLEAYGRCFVFNSCLPRVGEAHYDMAYAGSRRRSQKLDVFVPPARKRRGPVPVVVNLHGGGLISMDKRSYERFSRSLARAGYLVCNANYRLAPGADYRKQLQDVCAAVGWAYENAGRFGGDPTRMVLAGDSAGAWLAGWYAQAAADPGLLEGLDASTIPAGSLKALVLIYGAFDWQAILDRSRLLRPGISLMLRAAFGPDSPQRRELLQRFSVTRNLKPGFPPCVIVSGRTDPIHSTSRDFARACEEKGVAHRKVFLPWYLFPEATHAFMLIWFYPSALWSMLRIKLFLRRTVR
jgi:acetyl esterase/lipase